MHAIIIKSPTRSVDHILRELPSTWKVSVIDDPKTFGKDKFWIRFNLAFDICRNSKANRFCILPDDINFIDTYAMERINLEGVIMSPNTDHRINQWQGNASGLIIGTDNGYHIKSIGFNDGIVMFDRSMLDKLPTLKEMSLEWRDRHQSSGVGYQVTKHFRELDIPMLGTIPSLVYHGDHPSVMHPTERRLTPLVSDMSYPTKLKKIVGMATMKGRERAVEIAIDSLANQVDEIILYDNSINPDLTDNGKFYALDKIKEPCYFFTCDDDMEYHPHYISRMITAIERHTSIVTIHGRILGKKDVSYYRGHEVFRCNKNESYEGLIDVCGTGVTGFRTDYFHPKKLAYAEDKRMSDIIFSLEALRQNKKIVHLRHDSTMVKQIDLKGGYTIANDQVNREQRQIELANKMIDLKNENF